MTAHHHSSHGGASPPDESKRRGIGASGWLVRLLMVALLAVGAYYVIAEHGAHLLAAWPLLILLACPLIHLLHGHGGHGRRASDAGERNE